MSMLRANRQSWREIFYTGSDVPYAVPRYFFMPLSAPTLYPVSAPAANLARSDFGHAVRFYSDDRSFFDELTDFAAAVLRTREPVIMVATDEHCKLIREMLTQKGCDPERNHHLLLLEAEATMERFLIDNRPDPVRFRDLMLRNLARARGGYGRNEQRVTIFGEMVAILWSQGNPKAALELEELWNDLGRTQRFALICAYPARLFEGSEHWEAFRSVCGTHSEVLPDESYGALKSEDERLRAIAGLQVKARSLETERARHHQAETRLQSRIDERTAEVEQTRTQLQDLSGRLMRLRDQESQRIARELHDSTAQLLSVLSMYVDLLDGNKETFSPTAAQLISRSNALVKQILEEVRALSQGLYPPTLDIIGLGSALEWYCTHYAESTGIPVAVEIPEAMERLRQPIEMAMFRIVQGCLAKIHEHAAGSRVTVRVGHSREGATLSVTLGASGDFETGNSASADIFRPMPGEIQERVRPLKGRVFTVSDMRRSGLSVFFPREQTGSPDSDPAFSAS